MARAPGFGIAIPVSNEAQNIIPLLTRLAISRPVRIMVVSDGSTDGTDALVRAFAERSTVPVVLKTRPERRGKADAVNCLLAAMADIEIIAMVSGDTMPDEDCIGLLVGAFADPTVGVAAGRPVPTGPDGVPAVEVSRLLWSLHHRIALVNPKSTEVTVFRNVFPSIDPASRADEAAIEAAVTSRGYRVVYIPNALIRTNCPLSIRDYTKQRTSVTMGHLMLARDGYNVGTLSWGQRLRALGAVWREEGIRLPTLLRAIFLEIRVLVVAWLRLRFAPPPKGVWPRSDSTKRSFDERP